jgi:hypothetical protein
MGNYDQKHPDARDQEAKEISSPAFRVFSETELAENDDRKINVDDDQEKITKEEYHQVGRIHHKRRDRPGTAMENILDKITQEQRSGHDIQESHDDTGLLLLTILKRAKDSRY